MGYDGRHVHPEDAAGSPKKRLTRRGVIAGVGAATAAVGGRVLFAPFDAEAGQNPTTGAGPAGGPAGGVEKPWKHAVGDPRGSDIVLTSGKYKEARFGVMFKVRASVRASGSGLRLPAARVRIVGAATRHSD